MQTRIAPMLAVNDGNAAITFYKAAFDAEVLWQIDAGGHVVAGLAVGGAQFFLADESPPHGTHSPRSAGFTTVRIELFVDNPYAVLEQALAAGAKAREPMVEFNYEAIMSGPNPIKKMLQGSVFDPFGHMWLIGKVIG